MSHMASAVFGNEDFYLVMSAMFAALAAAGIGAGEWQLVWSVPFCIFLADCAGDEVEWRRELEENP